VRSVGATLANPSLNREFRGRGRTAFERNLLPGFARWVLDQLERREPDYLIPVETKGARVLEAVLRYARDELGEPVGVPVIYASALAYMDPEELADSRVVVVDDAVRTGGSLQRQKARIERYGPTVIESLACVGDATEPHPGVDCFRSVEPDAYRELVWQLAELVVARGLPPEVDHQLFELRLPGRLEPSWWALRALLAGHGTLTVDGPDLDGRSLQPLTLHSPALPNARGRGGGGPHKLRFFFDTANDCIYVVPVSFPPVALSTPPGLDGSDPEGWTYPADVARDLLADQIGFRDSLGSVLVASARTLDPETIFAAASTATEFELIRGLKSLLDRALPGSNIRAQREQFTRFYGELVAEDVVAAIEEALTGVPVATEAIRADAAAASAVEETAFLDQKVGLMTRDIATELRELFEQEKLRSPVSPPKRVGMSMSELTAFVGGDPLLASRCIDYGLAMTTLVPFVSMELRHEDELLLERKYRVSEPRFDESTPYVDMSDVRVELSAEMLAAICHCVARRSDRYRGQVLEPVLLTSLVGVLTSMICEEHSIELKALPGEVGEEIVLCADDHAVTLSDHGSEMLVSDGLTAEASPWFRKRWDDNDLRLDGRNSTEDIEEHVDLLIEFLDGLDTEAHEPLLRAWAMCTDHRLGLTHVRRSLDAALAKISRALKLVLRGERHSPEAVDVAELLDAARQKIDILDRDWAAPVRESWEPDPSKRQHRILSLLGAPEGATPAYELPSRLTETIAAIAPVAERVHTASARLWDDEPEAGDVELALEVLEICGQVRGALGSFHPEFEMPPLPEDLRARLVAAAQELLDIVDRVRAFVAATAGQFRGSLEDYRPLGENKRSVSVLSIDIAGSSEHGRLHNGEEHRRWVNGGLSIAAQWARAFVGREGRSRVGDEIWIEFEPGDAPVIAAAAALQHSAALRSTGVDGVSWTFHAGIDSGELEDDKPANVISHTMDRVTKLAKACDPDAEVDSAYLSPEAFKACSAGLHKAGLDERLDQVTLAGDSMHPVGLHSDAVMAAFCAQIDGLLATLDEGPGADQGGETPLEFGELPESDADEDAAEGS
jgi:Phosphoribosyl transferase domain